MPDNYRQMWTDLGLNLKNHDTLLEVLGKVYGDIFLSQKNRPKKTEYLDFVMSEVHGLRIKELVDGKKQGKKVIGTYCTFVPEEIILAADSVMVGLCAGADFSTEEAGKYLPKNTCALIKSTFGFKLGGVCPYLEASDLIVGENTCDGKKKAYEILKSLVKDLYVVDLPQTKNENAHKLLRAEYDKFRKHIEQLTGKTITVENLKKAIDTVNAKRSVIHRLSALRANKKLPISGLDSLLINQIFFYEDPVRFTSQINGLCDELEARIREGVSVAPEGTPRILISGCPMAVPNWKLPAIIETSGAAIVGEESCVGERGTRNLVDNSGKTIDALMDALVSRYLKIDCAIFSPNDERREHIREMYEKYKANGVILYGLQFCAPYTMEAMGIEKELEKDGIPALRIETDYSQEDMGQLKTRIQAFIERLKG
ncbi:MAG: 3-hydroxyacyl-ACP dehydratase [Candidatus Raymondbacteria bacterium RifOxyA12_full_50_37]|uniref:3-hydroxyacyl-ACP dehydratase n=1 Tax=Candidatus Raymondbacteria bacterium RIFOXYD12_FULL_49_13 TaxID=1817890 RepID=A0A1F7F2A6_UNCRA|nr:MAG: 3-hydroxyacyl-ACP dehydratase [Candidatus Raymondbacteria bacterium RifOxyA12_full_50_37]OGJ88627.1 MAG: 3-hydroxyacyl-ACP dehydratase [Candidatus Raymondbacteria bacterium RIFOXYA2_FULL_49_16]OGK00800.1 MAG: 3-hydroxyacyl-ACP dehydratase [Candidatus Raymondbacteria bacterium RIFOXYD12_FULL_49_13]OGK02897.1 MAG: 3-hydroxyacyl-ACP dehydratase [Candidatus Raymondbacteria bacterium RifOxyC12_full_50_8]OGK02947.1 MAG: 3-hydroxyacyl-ACP dehydratase [Candidatus Raymondbacteria bacterium RifOx